MCESLQLFPQRLHWFTFPLQQHVSSYYVKCCLLSFSHYFLAQRNPFATACFKLLCEVLSFTILSLFPGPKEPLCDSMFQVAMCSVVFYHSLIISWPKGTPLQQHISSYYVKCCLLPFSHYSLAQHFVILNVSEGSQKKSSI